MAEMDDLDLDALDGDESALGDGTGSADGVPTAGAKQDGKGSSHWKLLLVLILASGLCAVGLAYFLSGAGADSEKQSERVLDESAGPLVPLSRVRQISEQRRRMRLDTAARSSRNLYLTDQVEENALGGVSDRSDLVTIAGILNNYIEALALLFEIGRLVTNDYLTSQRQVREIFYEELMPKYRYAERRRKQLRSRVKSELFITMLDNLDYIAYHDSIAVSYMESYLRDENSNDFTKAIEFCYQAKLLKKEFWNQFSFYLKKYKIEFVRNEKLWRRYFGSWDEVEP